MRRSAPRAWLIGCSSVITAWSTGSPRQAPSSAPARAPESLVSAGTVKKTLNETEDAVRSQTERVPLSSVDAVSRLRRDAVQQAARAQAECVHEVRAPRPARRARAHRAARRHRLVPRA